MVLENEGQKTGNQPTSNRDKLRSSMFFFIRGKNQNYFRGIYSSNTGQKIHGLLRLNSLWPDLKIYDRLLMNKPETDADAETSDFIDFSKVDVKNLAALVRRTPQAGEKLNPGESNVTATEVDKFFRDLRRQEGNAPKVMAKDVVKGIKEGNPAKIVQDIMSGVLENNSDRMAAYIPLSAGLNVVTELAQRGYYPPLELVLIKVSEIVKANPAANIFVVFRDVADELIRLTPAPAAPAAPPAPAAPESN